MNFIPPTSSRTDHRERPGRATPGDYAADPRQGAWRWSATTRCAGEQQAQRRRRGGASCSASGSRTYIEVCGLGAVAACWARSGYAARAAGRRCRSVPPRPARCGRGDRGTPPTARATTTTFSQIVADHLAAWTLEDVEVLHGDTAVVPLGLDSYGSRSLRGRRRGHPQGGREGPRGRRDAGRPPARGGRGRPRVDRRRRSSVQGTPDSVRDHHGAGLRGLDGPRPARRASSRGWTATRPLRPAQLLLAVRDATRVRGRGRHRDRPGVDIQQVRGRGRLRRRHQPAGRRRPGDGRRGARASPRRCTRRRSTTRRAPC